MTPAPRSGSGRNQPSGKGGQGGKRGGRPGSDSAGKPRAGSGSKPGNGGKPGQARKSAAPKAFGGERFGKNLGPVKAAPRKSSSSHGQPAEHHPDGVRLQKVMAQAGVASRRVCEEMIEEGRVEVNGAVVTELGVRVKPDEAAIHVDGIRLQLDEEMMYYVFNKPQGVVSTMEDPEGRKCISNFLRKGTERLFHVGRLDVATEGLLLLTNDGELTNRLTHPSYEVPKTYLVQVRGPMPSGIGAKMKEGVELEDGRASVDSFRLVDSTPGHILVEVILHSGKNRVVRRLFDAVGFPVERLVRVKVGPIALGDQRQGTIRALGRQEVGHLLASVGM
ncbi:pseudouridine synthase [Arthrobacter roseus]|uniref:pseudouridine synthase n=1 Tax=Arthrobacter roseus TaxID=136274 RepID=UPI001964B226|nr:pseudouridine synthase [Arthrobacter roseus]MBM7848296.1 pseudouridine synthase [Arthrobacter roseus]